MPPSKEKSLCSEDFFPHQPDFKKKEIK